MSATGDDGRPRGHVVAFDLLPVAALLLRGERIVAVNPAYERFMAASAASVVGRTVDDLIGQFVGASDVSLAGAAAQSQLAGTSATGQLWLRVIDAAGRPRSIRCDWQPSVTPDESVIYLIDAEGEATAKAAAEGLARAAGELGRCRDEHEILERAADLLHARGLIVTTLLLREGDPLLEYGPMRSGARPDASRDGSAARAVRATRPRRELLWELNRDFHQRRAAFFQDVGPLVTAAYPGDAGDRVKAALPARRTVQAPLFVNDVAYGALVLTGDELTPTLAGSLEMFAELVARAIENVRLRTELVQRERLAALGEAAAVMAHEVRNPIGAILNAAALMQKHTPGDAVQADLLRVIGEEALRLDRLVGDLLDLGRPLTPRLRSVDLHELAQRSVAVLADRGEAGAAGAAEVVVLRPAEPVAAEIDPDLTQLALWNVVRNAVQASPPGKRVTVSVAARGEERSAVLVDDEGAGFPPEHVERVLEPFHTTRATGTGIGLAVVRRVVEACRGSIEIGASPAGGGRFVMVFPSK
jgi:signal transduction histidine kinase